MTQIQRCDGSGFVLTLDEAERLREDLIFLPSGTPRPEAKA